MTLSLRHGIWHWKKMVNGELYARTTKTGDKKLAEQIAAVWEGELIQQVLVMGHRPMLVHDALNAFLKEREGTKGYNACRNHVRHYFDLPNVRIYELQLHQVQGIIEKRREAGASHNTLVVATNYWNAVCRMCEQKKWSTGPRLPRVQQVQTRLRYLSADEEAKLFAAIDPKDAFPGRNPRTVRARQDNTDLLLFLLHMGCRYSEAAKMRWNQVDLSSRTVLMLRNKRGVNNTLVMSDQLHAMLTRRYAERKDEWVFSGKKSHNNNGAWLKDALKRAGISEADGRITLHTCRHTYASRMLKDAKLSLVEVQALLGHRKIQSTMVYSHIETGAVAEKAARVLSGMAA
jgi:integrase